MAMQALEFSDKRIPREHYCRDPFRFAKEELLGAYLCSNIGGVLTAGKITELEVYIGSCDKACHAYPNKLTKRTATMFRQGGCAYVFFVYGMYNQFNVVVGPEGQADAVLIRALEPVAGIEEMKKRRQTDDVKNLTTGPGKLCRALGIKAKIHDGVDLSGNLLWLAPNTQRYDFKAVPRVGIDYAQDYKDKPWRFYIKDNPFVSRK